MKHLIIITLLLSSCTKSWECCIVATTTDTGISDGVITNCVDFEGTTEEKEQKEAEGTMVLSAGGGQIDFVTTCVKD